MRLNISIIKYSDCVVRKFIGKLGIVLFFLQFSSECIWITDDHI